MLSISHQLHIQETAKAREFVLSDFAVLGIVSDFKKQKKTYEEAHAAIQAGSRAKVPDLSEDDLKVLNATEGEKRANLEIQLLQQQLMISREQLNIAQEAAAKTRQLELKNADLEARLDMMTKQQVDTEALRAEIRRLEREVGEAKGAAYIEGYKAGTRERGRGEETE